MDKKQNKHSFEPVHLRAKALKNGNKSLYLDIVSGGVRKKEYLKLYLVPETNKWGKAVNRNVMQQAEAMKAQRALEVMFNLPSAQKTTTNGNKLLYDYLRERQDYYASRGQTTTASQVHTLILHLEGCKVNKGTKLKEVTPDFIRRFIAYLRDDGARTRGGGSLADSTIASYCFTFRTLLNYAVRQGLIDNNPFTRLSSNEVPRMPHIERAFLTMEEVQRLARTECDDWDVKHAFLFSCFTGLRYVDVSQLKWKHIQKLGDGSYQVDITQQKTKAPVYIPLSENAMRWLPERGKKGRNELVYHLRNNVTTEAKLLKWSQRAGIEKHVTFHISRHTCATLLLYYGADLYTVSKILGHASIKTTQIYAAVVDSQKRRAVDNVPELKF